MAKIVSECPGCSDPLEWIVELVPWDTKKTYSIDSVPLTYAGVVSERKAYCMTCGCYYVPTFPFDPQAIAMGIRRVR